MNIARNDQALSPLQGDLCTIEQWHLLHEALAKVRTSSKTVTVDKQSLINLLIDHSKLHHKRHS